MGSHYSLVCPKLEAKLWLLFRNYFDLAERKRRWRIAEDIPWDKCNPNLNPAIADVVETFCAVEMYLPDYTSKMIPLVRHSKGRTWYYANWGYEESKHSMALSDWLLRSKQRTDEQMADLDKKIFSRDWNLPQDSPLGMLAYAMVQEHATFINYRNLRQRVRDQGGDPALDTILKFVALDEAAHYGILKQFFELFLEQDRETALVALRPILNRFQMPAIHDLLDESAKRIGRVRELAIFNEEIFFREVYHFLLHGLSLTKADMRAAPKVKKSMAV